MKEPLGSSIETQLKQWVGGGLPFGHRKPAIYDGYGSGLRLPSETVPAEGAPRRAVPPPTTRTRGDAGGRPPGSPGVRRCVHPPGPPPSIDPLMSGRGGGTSSLHDICRAAFFRFGRGSCFKVGGGGGGSVCPAPPPHGRWGRAEWVPSEGGFISTLGAKR